MERLKILKAEAELRLRNTETLRRRTFRAIAIKVATGRLSENEAAQMRREFWDARLRDLRIVKGEIATLSSRSS